jgi:hypothetical protein
VATQIIKSIATRDGYLDGLPGNGEESLENFAGITLSFMCGEKKFNFSLVQFNGLQGQPKILCVDWPVDKLAQIVKEPPEGHESRTILYRGLGGVENGHCTGNSWDVKQSLDNCEDVAQLVIIYDSTELSRRGRKRLGLHKLGLIKTPGPRRVFATEGLALLRLCASRGRVSVIAKVQEPGID